MGILQRDCNCSGHYYKCLSVYLMFLFSPIYQLTSTQAWPTRLSHVF